METIQT